MHRHIYVYTYAQRKSNQQIKTELFLLYKYTQFALSRDVKTLLMCEIVELHVYAYTYVCTHRNIGVY